MVQPEDGEDGAAVDVILKGKRQMKRKYGVVDYLRKHYPPPEGSGEVEVEFLEGYDSIEGPDGSIGFGVFVPPEEKIYIADDLPGGEESMIETWPTNGNTGFNIATTKHTTKRKRKTSPDRL